MKVEKTGGVGGEWLDKKAVKTGDLIKLTTAAEWVESQQEGRGKQLVAKCKVKGLDGEFNMAINTPSKNAIIDAFGDETTNWVGKVLTAAVETGIFAGRRGVMLNLIPDGYVQVEDASGYIVIQPKLKPPASIGNVPEEIDTNDIPF